MLKTVIQELIDQATPGTTITVPPGSYDIDTNNPLVLKSDITLDLTGVTLVALPTDKIFYIMVRIGSCNNVTILNGVIRGDRNTHLGPTDSSTGGGGAGIAIYDGSSNIKINGTKVTDLFADGIVILDGYKIELNNVICDHNRRQGMSVINMDGLHVVNSQFINNGGTPPGDGIDFECDYETQRITNVLVEQCIFAGNQGAGIGLGSPGTYSNISITPGNSFDKKTQPIWVAGNAGSLGTPWYAFLLNRTLGWLPFYRYWGYPTSWSK